MQLFIRYRNQLLGVFVLVTLAITPWLVSLYPVATNQGFYPKQPIPFSHKLHAGLHKIDCKYCHSSVERSIHASVPEGKVCMNCHSVVKTDSPYIQMITKAYKENRPIEWIRIHELPDYVYFPHKRHIAAGLQCQDCHGAVEHMDQVYQVGALTMGWCMECHLGQTTPPAILRAKYPDAAYPSGPVAPVECSTCHK
jgi:hypothetical protein